MLWSARAHTLRVDIKFDRFFAVLRTIAELGPLATSGEDFPRVAATILERVTESVDAAEGALFYYCDLSHTFTCTAKIGLESIPIHLAFKMAGPHRQNWEKLRLARQVDSTDIGDFFTEAPDRFAGIQCVQPLKVGTDLVGALCLGRRNGTEPYSEPDFDALHMMSAHLALMLQNRRLHESLRLQIEDNLRLVLSLHHSYDDALQAFATTIDAKTKHTRGHSLRVARYSAGMAAALGMDEAEKEGIRAAGHLHDIGKVIVDQTVLAKPAKLLPNEVQAVADHTTMGHQIVSGLNFPWPQLPDVVRWHHERSDGTGYPDKLQHDEISLPVRIMGVADTFDAMTSECPYRGSMSMQQAAREMTRLAPTKFDPNVVQALLIQLRRDAERKSTTPFLDVERVAELNVSELDHLSMALVAKTTGGKVYFA